MKRASGHLNGRYYEVTGEGPALVFAHGLGGSHMSWWQQVAHFSPRFTCVTFAHQGFWPSTPIPGGPNPNEYAADLAALADHLSLPPFVLIAQSMGGWTAVEYAQRPDHRLRGLVMAATTGSIAREGLGPVDAWEAECAATRAAVQAAGGHVAMGLTAQTEQPALVQLYRHVDETNRALDKEALRARMAAMRTRPPECLAAARCPVLLIAGAEDIVMPPFASAAIAARVPGARAAMLPRTGHSGYFERAAAFNALVEDFVAGL